MVYVDEEIKCLVITNLESGESAEYPIDNVSHVTNILIEPLEDGHHIFIFAEGIRVYHYILKKKELILKK